MKGKLNIVEVAEKIADTETPSSLVLSTDGSRVAYVVTPNSKKGDHEKRSIWIADTNKELSARQLTSGAYNDNQVALHPDGTRLFFLSDRHKAGGPAQLYAIWLDGGEASSLTSTDNKKPVVGFKVSPNGKYIAFTSADEPSQERRQKEKEKDDPIIFGDTKDNNRLSLLTLSTSTVRKLDLQTTHSVEEFVWSPDSDELLVGTRSIGGLDIALTEPTVFRRVGIAAKTRSSPQIVGKTPQPPSSIVWPAREYIALLQNFEPQEFSSALSLFFYQSNDLNVPVSRHYGEEYDAEDSLIVMGNGFVAVRVAISLTSRIDIWSTLQDKEPKAQGWYRTDNDALFTNFAGGITWGARVLNDGTHVLAAIKSSGPHNEPHNIWTGRSQGREGVTLSTRLSDHARWIYDMPKLQIKQVQWKGEDGELIEGVSTSLQGTEDSPLPCILRPHGGPYSRDILDFRLTYTSWNLLAWFGYLVLSPNYRGSMGRGNKFAAAAKNGMGTKDWSDSYGMVQHVIDIGLADPKRLGLGGWSQGGFLTAWGATHTKNIFKAGVMGAGVSDWGSMAEESDIPEGEIDLGGSAPWASESANGLPNFLKGSPIRNVRDVETAILILHGQDDKRVPVGQAVGFHRGLRREPKSSQHHQLVIYPREGHGFRERAHAVDVLKRTAEHFEAWL